MKPEGTGSKAKQTCNCICALLLTRDLEQVALTALKLNLLINKIDILIGPTLLGWYVGRLNKRINIKF